MEVFFVVADQRWLDGLDGNLAEVISPQIGDSDIFAEIFTQWIQLNPMNTQIFLKKGMGP